MSLQLLTAVVALLAAVAPSGITITGRVVADSTGEPIRNARVTVTSPAGATSGVLTDRDGRFTAAAAAGRSTVTASKAGYARSEPAPATAGDTIEIRLRQGAAISGRVRDNFGEPVTGVRVAAQPQAPAARDAAGAIGVTDDRGDYRLAGLTAGSFVVMITTTRPVTPLSSGSSIQRTYFPNAATAAEARALRLQPGDEQSGIDFAVPAAVGLSRPFSVTNFPAGVRPPQALGAQQRGGIVRGRVVGSDGQSLPHVMILLNSTFSAASFGSATTTTDDDGRFEVRDVAAGKFEILANKSGYVQAGGSTLTFDLAAGEVRGGMTLTLAHLGAVTGRLLDEYGDPIQDARMQALQVRYERGRRWLVPANTLGGTTDDLGHYRIHDVPPGQYIVEAASGQARGENVAGYARTFYPGSANTADASFVQVGLSQDAVGIDFALTRAATASISGTALAPSGARLTAGVAELQPSQRSASLALLATDTQISPEGTFEFRNVPPGQYVVQIYRGIPNANREGEFGSRQVTVLGTDISELVVQTTRGSTVAGRVTTDGGATTRLPGRQSGVALIPVPVDVDLSPQDGLALGMTRDDGIFELAGLHGPRRLQVRTPRGWALKEIRVNGIDVTDQPLELGRPDQSLTDVEVVLTDRITELSGTVTDDRARPAPRSIVVVFPTDRDRWYPGARFLGRAVAGADGAFTVTGLPAGIYLTAAVDRIPIDGADAWQDPAFLESIAAGASTVTLTDGQRASLTLRAGRASP